MEGGESAAGCCPSDWAAAIAALICMSLALALLIASLVSLGSPASSVSSASLLLLTSLFQAEMRCILLEETASDASFFSFAFSCSRSCLNLFFRVMNRSSHCE